MERKPQHDSLRGQLADSFQELAKNNVELVLGVLNAFENDFDPTEVRTALQLSIGIGETLKAALEEGKEYVLFLPDKSKRSLPEDNKNEGQKNTPKTFGELLIRKLDEALPNKPEFTQKELQEITNSVYGSSKFLKSQKNRTFNRKEAIEVLQEFLTTPNKNLKPKEEYRRSDLIKPNTTILSGTLSAWSSEIGLDWKEKPTVDFETQMQIKGLSLFQRLNLPPKDKPLPLTA